jgi:hypothetical protein
VDETHIEIAHSSAVQRLVEECILAIQNRFLQSPLDDVMPLPGLCRVLGLFALPACVSMVRDTA